MSDLPEVANDPRVQAMGQIILFVLNNIRDEVVLDSKTLRPQSLHSWCEKALEGAGFVLTKDEPVEKPKRKKARRR